MSRLSKKDIEELRDFFSLGCDYADTRTVVHETADRTLQEMGVDLGIECMLVVDGEYEGNIALEDFVEAFYSNIIQNVMNVIETQE